MNNDEKVTNIGIPLPIVTLNRIFLTFGVLFALISQQVWITTLLFVLLLPAVLFGKNYSPIYLLGSVLFKSIIKSAKYEDAALQRFNNTIAVTLLGISQIFFLFNQIIVGWIFASMVMIASGVALLGFCVGCFLYYQFKIQRYKIFGP
jgi:energy-converting hydrogenase Eha subunit E